MHIRESVLCLEKSVFHSMFAAVSSIQTPESLEVPASLTFKICYKDFFYCFDMLQKRLKCFKMFALKK